MDTNNTRKNALLHHRTVAANAHVSSLGNYGGYNKWRCLYSREQRDSPRLKASQRYLSIPSLIIVLYSLKDHTWKIADFGLTVEGSSSIAQTTNYSRGTSGYRAPELLSEGTMSAIRYTNKVDIFAIGCILFELVFRTKAFREDFAVLQYSLTPEEALTIPTASDVCPDEKRRQFISQTIH